MDRKTLKDDDDDDDDDDGDGDGDDDGGDDDDDDGDGDGDGDDDGGDDDDDDDDWVVATQIFSNFHLFMGDMIQIDEHIFFRWEVPPPTR